MSDLIFADSLSRLGTESAFVVLARAQKLASEGRDIINLGIGQPDFKTPGHIVEAGIKALRDGHHGYTPANGIAPLREAVAADLKRRHGADVNPDNVVVVPGGKPTMYFAIMMFGQPGVEIMYPNPGFPIYESVIKYSGAKPVPIALTGKRRICLLGRCNSEPDYGQDTADHHQQPGQPHGRCHAKGRSRQAGRRALEAPACGASV